ncbi:hypothetical protein [Nocardia sp. NPDC047654]|uniref:hypothetical protein n=1 Tax=Nocardia sp. NPDC047654 TaxID=3364314 RepID=UPI003719A82F
MSIGIRVALSAVCAGITVLGFASLAAAEPQVWGACGVSDNDAKVVRTFSITTGPVGGKPGTLLCGNRDSGFRHIKDRHMAEWEGLAAIERRNWRDIVDMAIEKSLSSPDKFTTQDGGKFCYTGQIYLVNKVSGQIAQTVQPTVIVTGSGKIITAFPGGGCAR